MEFDTVCSRCRKQYRYKRATGCSHDLCASCCVNKKRIQVKERCVEYKGGKCLRCGYNKPCLGVYEFHHLDPSVKEFQIGGNHCIAWERLKRELDKCILLCCLCHRELEEGFWCISELEKLI